MRPHTPPTGQADADWAQWNRRRQRVRRALIFLSVAMLCVLPLGIALGNTLLEEAGFLLVLSAIGCHGFLRTLSGQSAPPFRPLAGAQLSNAETERAIEHAAIKRRWLHVRERGRSRM